VTGAAGKIGSKTVLELVKHGHTVKALDRRPLPPEVRHTAETIYADLTDALAMLNAVQGCDAVAHIGAIPSPSVPADEVLRLNVIGTQNILEAAAAHDVPHVVLTSSVGALGFSFPKHPCLPDYLPVDTAHPRRPQDVYGLSKLMNEESAAAMTVAFRLALESDLTGHHVFYTMANDLTVNATARELAERHLPNLLGDLDRLTGKTFYDLTPAREKLGFVAERTWRGVLEATDAAV